MNNQEIEKKAVDLLNSGKDLKAKWKKESLNIELKRRLKN